MTIENYLVKVRIQSAKYKFRNKSEKSDLRQKKLVEVKENRQKAINREIEK